MLKILYNNDKQANKVLGTEILTGTLTLKILVHLQIPSFMQIRPYSLSVRYDGEIQTYRKCNEVGQLPECLVKKNMFVACGTIAIK